jgi:hypothetical protein
MVDDGNHVHVRDESPKYCTNQEFGGCCSASISRCGTSLQQNLVYAGDSGRVAVVMISVVANDVN